MAVAKESPNMFLLGILAVILGCMLALEKSGASVVKDMKELKQRQVDSEIANRSGQHQTEEAMQEMLQVQKKLEQKLSELEAQFSQREEDYLQRVEGQQGEMEELKQFVEAVKQTKRAEEEAIQEQARQEQTKQVRAKQQQAN
ncbi:uncharacterized protein LOC135342369 [Halichondria panicea]|uniref:uncharacterized protein LOC135342369 n=1 Tax=Halichondria panicea TaxID=6063 RepID=UPI00312BB4DE